MTDKKVHPIDSPDTCDSTIEYDNQILEEDPEEEQILEFDEIETPVEIEQKFAQYERNYRLRRIRELTRKPITKEKKRKQSNKIVA
ncbi:MAG: hypothetical protein SNJ70_11330 [Armatimonadota bacterium]